MADLNNVVLKNYPDAELKQFKKGAVLQDPGQESSKAYFVKSGILRSYTIDEKGKEHVFMFAPEGWIISDIESQAFHAPSQLFIDVLEDAEVYEITNQERNFMVNELKKELYEQQITQFTRRIGVLQRRVIMLMSATAAERYQHFMDTYPELPNRVPQRLIASYLGITPEALSKIKSNLLKSK